MREHPYERAIFDSWRNCARKGLCPDIVCPMHSGTEEEIVPLQKAYCLEIAAFRGGVGAIGAEMPERTAFLLTNDHGVLLKKNPGRFISLQIRGRNFLRRKLQRNQRSRACLAFE